MGCTPFALTIIMDPISTKAYFALSFKHCPIANPLLINVNFLILIALSTRSTEKLRHVNCFNSSELAERLTFLLITVLYLVVLNSEIKTIEMPIFPLTLLVVFGDPLCSGVIEVLRFSVIDEKSELRIYSEDLRVDSWAIWENFVEASLLVRAQRLIFDYNN